MGLFGWKEGNIWTYIWKFIAIWAQYALYDPVYDLALHIYNFVNSSWDVSTK